MKIENVFDRVVDIMAVIAGAILMVYGASLGLSPVWLGVRAGALLAPLQIAGNLAEGTGALVVPLGLSWAFGAYSPRMAGFTTGVLLAVVGAAQLTGRIALSAALGTAREPRAILLFLALLSATISFRCLVAPSAARRSSWSSAQNRGR